MESPSLNRSGHSRKEQWCAIKFCVKLGKSAGETFDLLQDAYDTNSLKRPTVADWHRRFVEMRQHQAEGSSTSSRPWGSVSIQEDQENMSDDPTREERPTTIREISEALQEFQGSAREFASVKVGMTTISPLLQPRLLSLNDCPKESIYSNPLRNYKVADSNVTTTGMSTSSAGKLLPSTYNRPRGLTDGDGGRDGSSLSRGQSGIGGSKCDSDNSSVFLHGGVGVLVVFIFLFLLTSFSNGLPNTF